MEEPPSNSKATEMTEGAQEIALQLQNLLQIPAINRQLPVQMKGTRGQYIPQISRPLMQPPVNTQGVHAQGPYLEEKENAFHPGQVGPYDNQRRRSGYLMEQNVSLLKKPFDHSVYKGMDVLFKWCEQGGKIVHQDIRENVGLFERSLLRVHGIHDVSRQYSMVDAKVRMVLKSHYVDSLAKKMIRSPEVKYFCAMCGDQLSSLFLATRHVLTSHHMLLELFFNREYTLRTIPMASEQHCEAVGEALLNVVAQQSLSSGEIAARINVLNYITNVLNGLPCNISMFGSSCTGIGFHDADLNINVSIPANENGKNDSSIENVPLIATILNLLSNDNMLEDVQPSYHSNRTRLSFTVNQLAPGVKCVVHFNNVCAVLFSNLVREYVSMNKVVKPVLLAFRYIAKLCEIDNQEVGMLPSHAYVIMGLHYLQRKEIVPVLSTMPRVSPSIPFSTAQEAFAAGFPNRSAENFSTVYIGRLFLSMLNYFAFQIDYAHSVISMSREEVMSTKDRAWSKRLIAIEDPLASLSNIGKAAASNKVCDHIVDRLKESFLYFAIPRVAAGPVYHGLVHERLIDRSLVFTRAILCPPPTDNLSDVQIVDFPCSAPVPETAVKLRAVKRNSTISSEAVFLVIPGIDLAHNCMYKREYAYEFSKEALYGKGPPVYCKACGAEGHPRVNCPEENLPPLAPVTKPNTAALHLIKSVLYLNYHREALKVEGYELRRRIMEEIHQLLQSEFPDLKMKIFGSSENGFGTKNSDLDICMKLDRFDNQNKEIINVEFNVNDGLVTVVNVLKRSPMLADVFCITGAKVPIVKFVHRPTHIQGDISFYNSLALSNTMLLKHYSDFDMRVKVLANILKKLGKICDISDASKGSLSSYAYMIMLIHYLQHVDSPVVPVLQELPPPGLKRGQPMPTYIIDNCNCYFYTDISRIHEVWEPFGMNYDSAEKLWLGFLRYYTEEFDFETYVVSIAQFAPLTKREKGWFTDCIAVEDPFEKTHNLGSGLSRRMSIHIIKTLRKFRSTFHTTLELGDLERAFEFYLDKQNLKDGNMPIDRQCRRCFKIGHIARNCTEYNRNTLNQDVIENYNNGDNGEQMSPQKSNVAEPEMILAPPAQHYSPADHMIPFYPMNGSWTPYIAPSHSLLPEYRFLWNVEDQPRDEFDRHLLQLVESTHGVSFTPGVLKKARSYPEGQDNKGLDILEFVKPKSEEAVVENDVDTNQDAGPILPPPGFAPRASAPNFTPVMNPYANGPQVYVQNFPRPPYPSFMYPIMPNPNEYRMIALPQQQQQQPDPRMMMMANFHVGQNGGFVNGNH